MRMACTYAVDVWERYVREGTPIEYTDGVVGLAHVVDMTLPTRAIHAVDRKLAGDAVDPKPIWDAYSEPMSALQDGDLDFPDGIASSYRAIYNLFGFVFGLCKLYDDGEIVIRQACDHDEWWTRTWDAWATRDVRYEPSELDAATFELLANGELAAAADACARDTRLHVALLALAGRTHEAVAIASALFAIDADDWLAAHVCFAGASDAIAVSDDRRYYAAISGNRYVVRDVADNRLRLAGRCGWTLRRVAFSGDGKRLLLAGEEADDIGPWRTILTGEELESRDYGYRAEHLGARTIVALGPAPAVVAASDREIAVLTNRGIDVIANRAVRGAAIRGTHVATFAGTSFSVWHQSTHEERVGMDLGAEVWHLMFTDTRIVVACRGRRAHVLDLAKRGS
jgi:hypothetical protein